ncbi:hypothetical protein D3C86_1628410 [compost metagenome]
MSNFIASLPSNTNVLESSTFSIPGIVSATVASEVVCSAVELFSFVVELPPQEAKDIAKAMTGKTNNFFIMLLYFLLKIGKILRLIVSFA